MIYDMTDPNDLPDWNLLDGYRDPLWHPAEE
jgi:hypothetical protein